MNIYILIGFNFNDDLILTDADKLLYKKIYVLSSPATTDIENVEVVSDKNALQFYEQMNFEKSEENVIFIYCRKDRMINNYLDVMYSLNTARFENRSYYVMKGNKLKLSDYPLVEHYVPWTGDKLPASLPERKDIQEMFEVLAKACRGYLKAGFHKYNGINTPEIESIPDGWMMNINTPEINHIVNYYGLLPAVDVNPSLEFIHNAQYRYILCDTLVKVLANYVVRNGIANTVDFDDWFNYKNWNLQKLNFYF